MNDLTGDLRAEVQAFLQQTGMGPTYFGQLAASNTRLVERLESGGRVWPETEQRIRAFMVSHRKASQ